GLESHGPYNGGGTFKASHQRERDRAGVDRHAGRADYVRRGENARGRADVALGKIGNSTRYWASPRVLVFGRCRLRDRNDAAGGRRMVVERRTIECGVAFDEHLDCW